MRISSARHVDGREVAEREVDARVIVVDRLGQVDDGNPLAAGGQLLLEELELVGRLQRVVAADGDQGVDAHRHQRVVDRLQRRGALGVLQVRRVGDVLARIGPGRADQDALAVARALQHVVVDADVVAAFDQRMVGAVFDQVRIAVQDADHLDVVAQERNGRGGNHGVGRRGRTAGKQNRHPANVRLHRAAVCDNVLLMEHSSIQFTVIELSVVSCQLYSAKFSRMQHSMSATDVHACLILISPSTSATSAR